MAPMADRDEVAPRRLRMIADTLGVPVEQFYEGGSPREFADTDECLRLWYKLRTDGGRTSVLDCLREALVREGT